MRVVPFTGELMPTTGTVESTGVRFRWMVAVATLLAASVDLPVKVSTTPAGQSARPGKTKLGLKTPADSCVVGRFGALPPTQALPFQTVVTPAMSREICKVTETAPLLTALSGWRSKTVLLSENGVN